MLYKLTAPLLDHRGKPITDPGPDGKPVEFTLGMALERAAVFGGGPQTSAKDKYEQYKLAQKLTGDTVELTAEEVARLKELTGAMFTPIAVGAVWTALENPLKALPDYPVGGTD